MRVRRGVLSRLPVFPMRQGLYHCSFPGAVVILDLVPDRYRLLTGDGADRFARLVAEKASILDIEWLAERGVTKAQCNPPADHIRPTRSALDHIQGRAATGSTFKSAWHQLKFKRRLPQRPLHELLDNLAASRPHPKRHHQQRSLEIAAASMRAKNFISAEDQCLPRSLAMLHMLFREGINADLVFGVDMPFAAHCWVQQGGMVLSDTLDRVLPFRPIMVV